MKLSPTFLLPLLPLISSQPSPIIVSLPYISYTSVYNPSTQLHSWKGIRYATPPTGKLRWQAPKPLDPVTNPPTVTASTNGKACPQAMPNIQGLGFIQGDEDCLFLNVWGAGLGSGNGTGREGGGKGLPVMVMFHGGGYGLGDGAQDMSAFLEANGGGILGVVVQYRLGAFGFLASPEVKAKGVLNAGLLDQNLALQWVQQHISKFGGDPARVTIAGESAGAGSVLLHAIAKNGELGTSLFTNIIAASPWVPTQPYYDDTISIRHYNDFAAAAGCASRDVVFDCLLAKDSLTLQRAANKVSTSPPTPRGNWAFIPVTDGTYIPSPPSIQLPLKKLNGLRALVGHNANEGSLIPPSTILTQTDLTTWLKSQFSNLTPQNITSLLATYPSTPDPLSPSTPRFETSGYGPATAINISQVATGQQQRCYNIYAEASVICPSYELSTAFSSSSSSSSSDRRYRAYHYQYSIPFAAHGADLSAIYGPATENQGGDFVLAFRKMYGNFVKTGNPSITLAEANGREGRGEAVVDWPEWKEGGGMAMMNLNQTGGTEYRVVSGNGATVRQSRGTGLRNEFGKVDAWEWEGGRGKRCEFWREIGKFIPQ